MFSAVPAVASDTSSLDLSNAWRTAAPYQVGFASSLEILDGDWSEVSRGEVVVRREPQASGPDRVWGVSFIEEPPSSVWIAIIDDPHLHLSSEVLEYALESSTPERKVLYQLLDLPFPISDRFWIIEISSNADVYARSGGLLWRREWRSIENGQWGGVYSLPTELQSGALSAVYAPVNEGSWTLLPVGVGTIVLYEGRADSAGNLPMGLVDRIALENVERTLSRLDEIASEAEAHYGEEGHYTIFAPNNEPLGRE